MKSVHPYLIFTGQCREAMEFYCDCLGGEITFMHTLADAPFDAPDEAKHLIFHSEMRAGDIVIKASDNMPTNETVVGSNVFMFTQIADQEEMLNAFAKLSDGGNIINPLGDTPNGGKFGTFCDKFGVQWMVESG